MPSAPGSNATEPLLRLPDVCQQVALSRSSIYERVARGEFPLPLKVGRASRWRADEVTAWKDQLPRRGEA